MFRPTTTPSLPSPLFIAKEQDRIGVPAAGRHDPERPPVRGL